MLHKIQNMYIIIDNLYIIENVKKKYYIQLYTLVYIKVYANTLTVS